MVDEGFEDSALPERMKLAVRWADVLIGDPTRVDQALRAELEATFTPAQIVELTAVVTMAQAFSKAAIAWGPPPTIPVMEVPTPTPTGTVA